MRRPWLSFSLTCLRFVSKEADNLEVPTTADKANHNETKPSEKENNNNNNKTTKNKPDLSSQRFRKEQLKT